MVWTRRKAVEKMTAIRALMTGLVDYAGLFPPASLDMMAAVRRYREYLSSADRWALGKFVVPAARLNEFSAAFHEECGGKCEPAWSLSVLLSGDAAVDDAAIAKLSPSATSVDAVELKASSADQAQRMLRGVKLGVPVYVEFAPAESWNMLPVLKRLGARAKIRTGGVTADAFPAMEAIAEFLLACANATVPFKATAGLHHAVRGRHNLTYEPGCATATMHGFVNVFLAAVLARRGEEDAALVDTLNVTDPSAFAFGKSAVRWLGFDAGAEEIESTRREFAVSYGSCSFTEPMEEAKALGWL